MPPTLMKGSEEGGWLWVCIQLGVRSETLWRLCCFLLWSKGPCRPILRERSFAFGVTVIHPLIPLNSVMVPSYPGALVTSPVVGIENHSGALVEVAVACILHRAYGGFGSRFLMVMWKSWGGIEAPASWVGSFSFL